MKITIRTKPLKDDRESLYLDIYIPENPLNSRIRTRLKLFLYKNPKDHLERSHNKETMKLAENIKAKQQIELQNSHYKFNAGNKVKQNFIEYMRKLTEDRKESKGNYGNWYSALKQLIAFKGSNIPFEVIDEEFLEEFKKYLSNELSINSSSSYFNKIRATLNQAFDERIISDNPVKRVRSIKSENPQREYLTEEELKQLFKTECELPSLKSAFLFSSLTGLRWSDIIKLKWEDIRHSNDMGYYVNFRQQKTKQLEYQPINQQAFELLGVKKKKDDIIFKGLKYSAWTNLKLAQWVMKAGITKNITFHCARHTYATLLLTKGSDIYTVSKLLGHSHLKTTEIYTKVIDHKKVDAINLLPKLD